MRGLRKDRGCWTEWVLEDGGVGFGWRTLLAIAYTGCHGFVEGRWKGGDGDAEEGEERGESHVLNMLKWNWDMQ